MTIQEDNDDFQTPAHNKTNKNQQQINIMIQKQQEEDYLKKIIQIEMELKQTQNKLKQIYIKSQSFSNKFTLEHLQLDYQIKNLRKIIQDLKFMHIKYTIYIKRKKRQAIRIRQQELKLNKESQKLKQKQKFDKEIAEKSQNIEKQRQKIRQRMKNIGQENEEKQLSQQEQSLQSKKSKTFSEKMQELDKREQQIISFKKAQQKYYDERIRRIQAGEDLTALQIDKVALQVQQIKYISKEKKLQISQLNKDQNNQIKKQNKHAQQLKTYRRRFQYLQQYQQSQRRALRRQNQYNYPSRYYSIYDQLYVRLNYFTQWKFLY